MTKEELLKALVQISKMKCKHHADTYPGEHDDCEDCALHIEVYDPYCLADVYTIYKGDTIKCS